VTQIVDNPAIDEDLAESGVPAVEPEPGDGTAVTMESALSEAERAIEQAVRAAAVATGALKKALAGARTGQIKELRKALAAAEQATAGLAEQASGAAAGFTFDEQAYLASGGYVRELLAVADARGVSIFEEDGQLLCYPSLVRVVSAEAAVEIDKVRERRLRPSVLVDQLARNQGRAPRFRPEAFVDSLRNAYELLVARDGKKDDAVVKLVEIWAVLTMLPGQGGRYSRQEFARDLYLLDQSGVVCTPRSPRQLRWAASTGTKGAGTLVTVSRTGQPQRYWGISFTVATLAGAGDA
jgi:hypothetical protein